MMNIENKNEINIGFDVNKVSTPAFVVDEKLIAKNLEVLKYVREMTGCKILLAQKAFSMYSLYPLIGEYLDGVAASGLFEARLGFEEMGKEVHTFAPAFSDSEFEDVMRFSDHIVFNSPTQWAKFKPRVKANPKEIGCGIRINPEYSELEHELYDPCAKFSRLGAVREQLEILDWDGIDGIHFHTMCEQGADTLWRTLEILDEEFGQYLKKVKWINFGGGQHITKADYDIDLLVKSIKFIKDKYGLEIYLEPGEAVALNAGWLVSTVLDITENAMRIAILDTAVPCHMPDVIEMPYQPEIVGAGKLGKKAYGYRIGGISCLAGDVAGSYSFDKPLEVGDKLVFTDMAHYSMVKTNTFNGIPLPSIYLAKSDGELEKVREFGFEDFKSRL